MKKIVTLLFALLIGSVAVNSAVADAASENFPNRKAIIIDNCPFVKLSDFRLENKYEDYKFRLDTDLKWQNASKNAIVAFEVVIAYYDPFNRAIQAGGVWLVPGHNSADWKPLAPGESSGDGLRHYDTEYVYTAFAFVRSVRLDDGTVWQFDANQVEAKIKQALPAIKDFSNVDPHPTAKSN